MQTQTIIEATCTGIALLLISGVEGRYVSALYSAASQMKQLEEVEKHLRGLQKVLVKPTIIDFVETNLISRAGKAKLMLDVGKAAGKIQ